MTKAEGVNAFKCPCCATVQQEEQMKRLMSFVTSYPYPNDLITAAKERRLQWACDACIERGKAIRADIKKHVPAGYSALPVLAYVDKEKVCATCEEAFVFTKEEQQFWYEEIQLTVYADAKNCAPCRKQRRKERSINTRRSEIKKNLDLNNFEQLEELIGTYIASGHTTKAKQYLAHARKIKPRSAEMDRRIREINMRINFGA